MIDYSYALGFCFWINSTQFPASVSGNSEHCSKITGALRAFREEFSSDIMITLAPVEMTKSPF